MFAGGGSCLQFVTITTSGKCGKVERQEPEVCVRFIVFRYFLRWMQVLGTGRAELGGSERQNPRES